MWLNDISCRKRLPEEVTRILSVRNTTVQLRRPWAPRCTASQKDRQRRTDRRHYDAKRDEYDRLKKRYVVRYVCGLIVDRRRRRVCEIGRMQSDLRDPSVLQVRMRDLRIDDNHQQNVNVAASQALCVSAVLYDVVIRMWTKER